MSDIIRVFIAIELPKNVKTECERVSQQLSTLVPKTAVRWVKPDKMHLTLRFLGDTVVARLSSIIEVLNSSLKSQEPFALQLNHLGCFPNQKRPRVLWIGLQAEDDALQKLKRRIDEALVPLGWEVENKKFQAHVTLARVKNGRQLTNMNWNINIEPIAFAVTAVALIKSELTPQGPIYTIQHQTRL